VADGVLPPTGPARRTFLIEAHPHGDAVLRVLAPFAAQGANIVTVESAQTPAHTSIRIEAAGLDEGVAQHLARRLRALPVVIGVGLGWRALA
jgi:ACT domain-containing protein